MANHQKSRNPWKFFLLTFAYSWIIWIPSVLDGIGIDLPFSVAGYSTVAVIIGAFAPLLAAITLIARKDASKGIKSYLGQALDFHIKPLYLILALVLPLVIHVIAHYLALGVGLDVAQTLFPTETPIAPIILAIPYFILMMVIGGGQEEFGWRGYAQEPLQEKIGVIPASLVIGVIWGIWHLPLWFMAGDLHSAYSFLAFVMMTTSISVMYAWLYNSSGKKLIVVIFFHAMNNTAAPLLPFLHGIEGKPESAYWIYAAVNMVFGFVFAYVLVKESKP
ncbi:MAG: CPBP family intramembrane metalloprotease [Ardenticatenaceae bacterium]|nr:CPBP family intramembrane metalloprotease [Anaerolineales bacterium]MCB8923275.1 CPBP family intramembrane metalloprotease [Ardenticatenaceae bacterium]